AEPPPPATARRAQAEHHRGQRAVLLVEPDLPGRRRRSEPRRPAAVPRRAVRLRDLPVERRRLLPQSLRLGRAQIPIRPTDTAPRRVLIIGAAGGNEVLTSLYYNSGHVDAIELNPVTYDLVTNRFADYDGHLADRPNVNYEQGDGRTFLARSNDTYDIV